MQREVSPVAKRQDAGAQLKSGGVAVVRTVAPSFELGVFRSRESCEPVLTGERKLSFARQGALTHRTRSDVPRLKAWATVLTPATPTHRGFFRTTRADFTPASTQ